MYIFILTNVNFLVNTLIIGSSKCKTSNPNTHTIELEDLYEENSHCILRRSIIYENRHSTSNLGDKREGNMEIRYIEKPYIFRRVLADGTVEYYVGTVIEIVELDIWTQIFIHVKTDKEAFEKLRQINEAIERQGGLEKPRETTLEDEIKKAAREIIEVLKRKYGTKDPPQK